MNSHYDDNPFLRFLGTSLDEWRDGYVCVSLPLSDRHMNRAGTVHGGVLMTLLDHAGGYCGLFCTVPGNRRYAVTLSLTSNFVAQSNSGKLLTIGERVRAGSKVFFSKSEVRTDTGVVVATASGVYRYRSGSELPEGKPQRPYSLA